MTPEYPFPLSGKNRFPSETTPLDGSYDKRRPRQYWHDPAALRRREPSDPYLIHVVDPNTGDYVLFCTIPCGWAATANIDGIPEFPQAIPGPPDVIIELNGGTAQALIDATDLITLADLDRLTARLANDTGVTPEWAEQGPLAGAGIYHLFRAQNTQTAGSLWNGMNSLGVGFPGKFVYDARNGWSFEFADVTNMYLPDPNADFGVDPDPIPCPMDPLKPGEYLIGPPTPMSPEPWVQFSWVQFAKP